MDMHKIRIEGIRRNILIVTTMIPELLATSSNQMSYYNVIHCQIHITLSLLSKQMEISYAIHM